MGKIARRIYIAGLMAGVALTLGVLAIVLAILTAVPAH